MGLPSNDPRSILESHFSYLRLLAHMELDPRLRSKFDPADLAQLTLLRACESWHTFRGHSTSDLHAWLQKILLNLIVDHARKYLRPDLDLSQAPGVSQSSVVASLAAELTSPSQRVMREELKRQLAAGMATLSEDQRIALELKHFEGKSVAEISQRMGRSTAAVAGLLRRGLDALRDLLAQAE
jgi:RNA polymerase sigma-70 factor, ECF subfamily